MRFFLYARKVRRLGDLMRIVWFTLALLGPLVSLVNQSDMAVLGFPVPATLAELETYPDQLKTYFAASVEIRRNMANWHRNIVAGINGPSKVGDVWIGQNGWLFWEFLVDDRRYRKRERSSYERLRQLQARMEANQAVCREHGSLYVPVLVPAKRDLYGEFLPLRAGERVEVYSNVELMTRFLNAKSGVVRAVETISELRKLKRESPVFFRTDSHWNSFGGFAATRAISRRLKERFPGVKVPRLADIEVSTRSVSGGNEARILGADTEFEETFADVDYLDGLKVSGRDGGRLNLPLINISNVGSTNETVFPTAEIRSALIFHDSFGYALVDHLGRQFRAARWVWSDFQADMVARGRPDVVVQLFLL